MFFPAPSRRFASRAIARIVSVDAGLKFEVSLTLGSRDDLQLQPGAQVWLVIKTYSCHLVTQ